jgi:eukaryotic-like serine/threonine-protein kinase
MLKAGAQVEKYVVLEHLGGGGFAEVYKARHIHLGTAHALKILRAEFVSNESVRLRFLDEARVQAQLVHPNIARVSDILVSQGVAGLVMEYLEGRSLADFIEKRQGPATEAEILAIMLPVLDGLHFAHERGVVHRDVKPDNIFLVGGPAGPWIPKVLDFGIAKVRGELRQEGKRKSTLATGMGTEGYASPEQLRSAADVDRRADIFSLGVTLYELATGQLPFEGHSDVDRLMALMNGDYEIPDGLRRRSPQIAGVIQRALQTNRRDRYPDCQAFGKPLKSWPVAESASALQFERQLLISLLRRRVLSLSASLRAQHRLSSIQPSTPADPVDEWIAERDIRRVLWCVAFFVFLYGAVTSAANC